MKLWMKTISIGNILLLVRNDWFTHFDGPGALTRWGLHLGPFSIIALRTRKHDVADEQQKRLL